MNGLEYKRLRKRLGTQSAVAKKIGCSRHTLARHEGLDVVPHQAALVMRAAVITPELYERLAAITSFMHDNAALIGACGGVQFPAEETLKRYRDLARDLGAEV